jgi:hypothetical protein
MLHAVPNLHNISGMNIALRVAAVAFSALGLAPLIASAQSFVLDTGQPASNTSPAPVVLSAPYAAEFAVSANTQITNVSAWLTAGGAQPGQTFTFALYSSSSFTSLRFSNLSPLANDTVSPSYETAGWTSAIVNWNLATAGDYWLVIEPGSTSQLDLPQETSSSTGTVPALSFAKKNGSGTMTAGTGPAIGLEITAVPEPSTYALMLAGVSLLAWIARARKPARR